MPGHVQQHREASSPGRLITYVQAPMDSYRSPWTSTRSPNTEPGRYADPRDWVPQPSSPTGCAGLTYAVDVFQRGPVVPPSR